VLADVESAGADLIVFGGDVAAGLLPVETIERLMGLDGARFVQGNADRILVEIFDGAEPAEGGLIDEWCASQLERPHRDFLASFEPTVVIGDVCFCHATPHSDEPAFTRITPDERVRELLGDVEQSVVVCGHTHMQFDRTVDGVRVVNAGSVGMSYGTTDACWALLEGTDVELRRTSYDLEAAAERLRASGHSLRDELIAENVLTSPSEDEVLELFRKRYG
jgi:Calcineurin-like phosphoesterase superfamily domain